MVGWEVLVTGILREQLVDMQMETQTPLGRLPFLHSFQQCVLSSSQPLHHCWSLPSRVSHLCARDGGDGIETGVRYEGV